MFTSVESVDRITYAIVSRFSEDWKTTPSIYFHKQLDVTSSSPSQDVIYPPQIVTNHKVFPTFVKDCARLKRRNCKSPGQVPCLSLGWPRDQ